MILIVPVLFVLSILQKRKTIYTLQSLIAALNVMFNGSRVEKKDGKPAGDQTMKLTTKLLKEMIKEELGNMTENENPILQVAQAVGVPKRIEEEQIDEGFENLTPENLQMAVDMLIKMSQEFAPVIAGSGLLAAAMKAKEMLAGAEEVDTRDDLYDDED